MHKTHNPSAIAPPLSRYSHGIEASAAARWLHVSGQVGVAEDGTLANGPKAQMELAWQNVLSVLDSAGMGPRDLVKVTAYVTRGEDVGIYREVRDRMLEGAEPASTLVIVAGLAQPGWLVEIEAVAASVAPVEQPT